MHKDLLRLRREEPVLAPRDHRPMDGAVLGEKAFLLRYFGDAPRDDRLLIVNLGTDYRFCPLAQPLLAAPAKLRWSMLWSSGDVRYGGLGTPELEMDENWKLSGETAVWLEPRNFQDE